jgi:hypothetical protein
MIGLGLLGVPLVRPPVLNPGATLEFARSTISIQTIPLHHTARHNSTGRWLREARWSIFQ